LKIRGTGTVAEMEWHHLLCSKNGWDNYLLAMDWYIIELNGLAVSI
jgi:hypothetical protein